MGQLDCAQQLEEKMTWTTWELTSKYLSNVMKKGNTFALYVSKGRARTIWSIWPESRLWLPVRLSRLQVRPLLWYHCLRLSCLQQLSTTVLGVDKEGLMIEYRLIFEGMDVGKEVGWSLEMLEESDQFFLWPGDKSKTNSQIIARIN